MASIPNLSEIQHISERETTVKEAREEAPNVRIARQIEENANLEQNAAEQAASVAKTKGRRLTGETSTAVDKTRNTTGQPLEQAVEEGKRDVSDIQAAGAEKLEQLKEMATKAAASVQEYISPQSGQHKSAEGHESGGTIPSHQGATSSANSNTATSTLASARAAASSAMGSAGAAAQNVLGTAGTQGAQAKDMPASSTEIPAISAPLESGGRKLDTTYPPRDVKGVGKNESKGTD